MFFVLIYNYLSIRTTQESLGSMETEWYYIK